MHGLFFDVRPRPGHMPRYFEHVDRLKPILAGFRGLLFLERFRPLDEADALLSHQLWQDEAALAAWRRNATHRASQAAGRKVHFEGYRIRVGAQEIHLPEVSAMPENAALSPAGDPGRFLIASYGAAPVPHGRAYESVTRPGRFVTLAEAASRRDARDHASRLCDGGQEEVRVFRIARDYTMHDRDEAPGQG